MKKLQNGSKNVYLNKKEICDTLCSLDVERGELYADDEAGYTFFVAFIEVVFFLL